MMWFEVEDETLCVSYCPYYDKLQISIINKAFAQNPDTFWYTDDDDDDDDGMNGCLT